MAEWQLVQQVSVGQQQGMRNATGVMWIKSSSERFKFNIDVSFSSCIT